MSENSGVRLQKFHCICTMWENIKFICTCCETGQKSLPESFSICF